MSFAVPPAEPAGVGSKTRLGVVLEVVGNELADDDELDELLLLLPRPGGRPRFPFPRPFAMTGWYDF